MFFKFIQIKLAEILICVIIKYIISKTWSKIQKILFFEFCVFFFHFQFRQYVKNYGQENNENYYSFSIGVFALVCHRSLKKHVNIYKPYGVWTNYLLLALSTKQAIAVAVNFKHFHRSVLYNKSMVRLNSVLVE
jgi:hypothetical protein